jgi:hypothetical protein
MSPTQIPTWVSVAISLLAVVIAGLALGWNIYRDVVLRARVQVSFGVARVVQAGRPLSASPQFIKISATNHGPGPVKIEMIAGRYAPLWRRLFRRTHYFVIISDFTNPMNKPLPHRLDIGERLDLFLPHDHQSILGTNATDIGVNDSFGRSHFAKRADLRQARRQYAKDFPDAPPIRPV